MGNALVALVLTVVPHHHHVQHHPPPQHQHGCTDSSWRSTVTSDESYIIGHESSFHTWAQNPDSSAYGLGQLETAARVAASDKTGVPADTAAPCGQLKLFRSYVEERYGSTANAVYFWSSHGYY